MAKKTPKVAQAIAGGPVIGGVGAYAQPGYTPPKPPSRITKPSGVVVAPVAQGRVRLTSTADQGQTITAWLNAPFVPTGADVGGWSVAARDGDVGIPEYTGTDPEGWTFSLLLDAWNGRLDLHPGLQRLLDLGRRGARVRPAEIAVTGTVPAGVARRRWLLTQATPAAEGLIDGTDGELYRVAVACQIMAPEQAETVSAPAAIAKAGRKAKVKTVAPVKGESLLDLLMRVRGTTTGWHDVAALNSVRDPEAALLPKTKKVRIP